MQNNTHDQKERETRRRFLKSTGAVAAGLTLAGLAPARAAKETLALEGGAKAITTPDAKHGEASRWLLYQKAEEEAVLKLIRHSSYEPINVLERDWKAYTKSPYVKAFEKVWAHRKSLA